MNNQWGHFRYAISLRTIVPYICSPSNQLPPRTPIPPPPPNSFYDATVDWNGPSKS